MSSLSIHTHASLQATLSPRLQKAVRLLQMSSQDFAQVVRDALDTNPFLEQDEPALIDAAAEAANDEPDEPQLTWGADGIRRLARAPDLTVFDTLQAPISLADHLLGQLNVLQLSERDRALALAVVESLDEDGYLRVPVAEAGDAADLDPPPDAEELAIALKRVQALDPAGVAARDLRECLELQLANISDPQQRALAARMLRDHLDALAAHDFRGLMRRLGCDGSSVEAACAAIRRLDPHPGWRFSPPSTAYITPDVIARKVRGRWVATLNEAVVPRVKVNRDYVELFKRHRSAQNDELGAHLQEARWTVRNVEQRFSTILAVAEAILQRQHLFLAYGPMAMKPLALREIAQELGVHESTVSRVTNNKFMATPCGVFELKFFFSRGLGTARGGECSPTAIRGLMREMIAAERPGQPLSDVEIARELEQQGLKVARRTVTKYRQLLRIDPAERRKEHAVPR
ncbi:RNA polymerase factor sigma-54 [Ramlibacter solisilvae]|uniref:RNA polymerase sigma-54 factor n=1 Tax=Ramlibacter tataouinensis TaxID=94132 RepID=A0A127JVP3_9BURK|nr:RNA polymerase factor sigma-54 [Ramlibacter tataouinensis]AMO23953.1 RNA polymerase subunit sigma-54 [Ramlibacter tataouinensis]